MSYPVAEPASEEYAYVDPKKATYDMAKLPVVYHPLDAWNTLGKVPPSESSYYYYMFLGGVGGLGVTILTQIQTGRPKFSQLYKHVNMTLFGVGLTYVLFRWYRNRHARRDAVIQHYLETHYDDFPLVRRRKVKETFGTWFPVR